MYDIQKGYIKLNIPEYKFYKNKDEVSHIDKFTHNRMNGILYLEAKALSPVIFTDNKLEAESNNVILKFSKTPQNKFYIPGSSLKGSIKTYSQALSFSCIDKNECSVHDRELCMACYLFGSLGKLGLIQFDDSIIENISINYCNGPNQWQGKKGKDNNKMKIYSFKLKEIAKNRNVIKYECIKPGEIFPFNVVFKGLKKNELGLLLLSMGLKKDKRFGLKFGRGKNIGFGNVLVDLEKIKFKKPDFSENNIYEGERKEEFVQKTIYTYLNSLKDKQVIEENLTLLVNDTMEEGLKNE